MMGFDGGWLWMVFGFIVFILFWGGVIWLVVWLVRNVTGHGGSRSDSQNPLDIAKARYAKGEITKEQFDQIKKDLS